MECSSCAAKDQITIAGKTFCAQCGTPVSDTKPSTNSQAVPAASQPAILPSETAQPIPQQILPTTAISDPVLAPSTPTEIQPAVASNQTTAPVQAMPSFSSSATPPISQNTEPAPVISPQPSVIPVDENTPVQPQPADLLPPPNASTMDKARQTIALAQASAVQANTQQPVQDITLKPINVPQQETSVQNTSPQIITHSPQAIESSQGENIGSELSSLDSHDEGVFTDDQLSQLASTDAQTSIHSGSQIHSTPSQIRPMNDIKPAAQPSVLDTAPLQTVSNQPAPIAQTPIVTNTQGSIDSVSIKEPSPLTAGSKITPNNQVSTVNAQAAKAATSAASETSTLLDQTQPTKPEGKTKSKKVAGKVASVGLSMAGVILLGVYVWQINYPNLAIKVASSKAGISANLPSYLPNGWKVTGDISANPGTISYNINSQDGDKSATVNQSRTDWDSQALAENYIATKSENYKAVQAQGLTIYLYNGNQASWVNHGTWYRIEGSDTGISQDQIIKMATSL